ncbi:hypothetical protein BJ165DRAFT_1517870 [Panaeolus papilionaceus]|nr:hypothetical protein BJ165DRAFT_1517870 [Panaeolus papilionaceus]
MKWESRCTSDNVSVKVGFESSQLYGMTRRRNGMISDNAEFYGLQIYKTIRSCMNKRPLL